MTDADGYIHHSFLSLSDVAAKVQVSAAEIENLVAHAIIPGPSYRIADDSRSVTSHIFGRQDQQFENASGPFFDRSIVAWIERLADPIVFHRRDYEEARQIFSTDLPIDDIDEEWLSTYLHWQKGTYGVCVVSPIDFRAIVEKQAAAARLRHWHELFVRNGSIPIGARQEVEKDLVYYDRVTKSFAPWDHKLSSRYSIYEPLKIALAVDPVL